jgi:hypothetical protein
MTPDLQALAAHFPPEAISWRPGSTSKDKTKAKALAYLDARDVMDRFDQVCGAGGWQTEYLGINAKITCCRIGVKIGGEWVWRTNGAGETDIEGEKGACSDAFKRAAVLWGVGRYLYAIDSPWVALNEWKQIPESEMPKLRALLTRAGGSTSTVKTMPQQTNATTGRMSAAQAKREGGWEMIIKSLSLCKTDLEITALLADNSHLISRWPANWEMPFADKVAWHRENVKQQAAA